MSDDKAVDGLNKALEDAKSKAQDWLGQRNSIATQLTNIRDTANELLQQLTGGGADMAVAVRRGRRGRPKGSGTGKKRGRRTFTAAQREEQRKRMKKYWAARKAAGGAKKK